MLNRQQLAAVVVVYLFSTMLALCPAAAQAPGPPPVNIAPYKTEAIATIQSLRTANVSSGIGADLGEDIAGDVTFTILKLHIHTFKALTPEGTPITADAVIEAVAREPIPKALQGKQVEILMEERGNTERHRWLITKFIPVSSKGPGNKQD